MAHKLRLPQGKHGASARYWRTVRKIHDLPTVKLKRPCRRASKRRILTGKYWVDPSKAEHDLLGIDSKLDLE